MNDELERMWKYAIVTYFKALFHYFHGRKATKNLLQDSRFTVGDTNSGPPENEEGIKPLYRDFRRQN